MAEGGGGGSRLNSMLEVADHPLVFSLAITFMVIFWMAMLTFLFQYLGWTGPASLSQHP